MNLSLQEVKDKLIFVGAEDKNSLVDFTEEQKNIIYGYIDELYQSDEARKIFNQMDEPIRVFAWKFFGGDKYFGRTIEIDPNPIIAFDMGVFVDDYEEEFRQNIGIKEFRKGYISETGEFVDYDVKHAFMHELIHAITGLTDNEGFRGFSSRADSAGPTQVEANKIHAQLNAPIRISYDGTKDYYEDGEEPIRDAIKKGTQFTKGKLANGENPEITLGVFVTGSNVDTSNNQPPTNDLLISGGLQGNKNFITGKGNDYLYGGRGEDTLNSGEDNDYLYGGKRNDSLDGGMGEDVAEFIGKFKDYDYDKSEDNEVITLNHVRGFRAGDPSDGTDTLKNIEWGIFDGEREDLGISNLASSETQIARRRLIPLPLADGIETTEYVEVQSTIANPNPNDPPTPPTISLTAPVAMLDGDVDYTLNILPYEPDTEYNVVYVIDTSISIDAVELQTIQDAYTDLTNFYINEGIAENINFGVVSFDSSGRFHTGSSGGRNLTADEAITALQD